MQIRNPLLNCLLAILLISTSACFKPKLVDPDEPIGIGDIEWEMMENFASLDPITNIRATDVELHLISNSEFIRINADNEVLFKRQLIGLSNVNGRPAMHDNVFSRIIVDTQGKETLEFYLTKNPTQIQSFFVPDLGAATDIDVDTDVRNMGAFNADGTRYLLPCIVGDTYVCYLFDIQLNATTDSFVEVTMIQEIPIDDLFEGENVLQNIKHINNNFWLATKEGGFKITEEGELSRVFSVGQYKIDYFQRGAEVWAVGFNTYDLSFTTDAGNTWTRLDKDSDVRYTENVNDYLLTQKGQGWKWERVDEDLEDTKTVLFPPDLQTSSGNAYQNVTYFAGNYYFCHEKEIHYIKDVLVE